MTSKMVCSQHLFNDTILFMLFSCAYFIFDFILAESTLVVICALGNEEPTKKRKICKEDATGPTPCRESMSLIDNNQSLYVIFK